MKTFAADERIHANAIAQQRAARATTRRIHRHDGDVAIREVAHEALQQLVVEAGFTRAAGAGEADDRRAALCFRDRPLQLLRGSVVLARGFEQRNRLRQVMVIARIERGAGTERISRLARGGDALHHVVDHSIQAQTPAVFGRVDLFDAVLFERRHFVRSNRAAAADDHPDVVRRPVP